MRRKFVDFHQFLFPVFFREARIACPIRRSPTNILVPPVHSQPSYFDNYSGITC